MTRHYHRYRRNYKELAKQLEIKAFLPPDSSVELAQHRIGGIVTYFHEAIAECNWLKAPELVDALARSCYLQGVSDCAEAFARKEIMFPEENSDAR